MTSPFASIRRSFLLGMIFVLVISALGAPLAFAQQKVLKYDVPFEGGAGAYAYKASVDQNAATLVLGLKAQAGASCDPKTDPYKCDSHLYNRTPNCPSAISIGPSGTLALPVAPPGSIPRSGGANVSDGSEPPQGSPFRLVNLPSRAHMARAGGDPGAGGLASKSVTDPVGRDEPEAHTTTDMGTFSGGSYEERCWAGTNDDGSPKPVSPSGGYTHLLSRSSLTPSTYHLAECREDQCSFGSSSDPFSAEKAVTAVYLREEGRKLLGTLTADVQGMSFGGGALTADNLFTLISFESDGTSGGLTWKSLSTSSNVRIGGQQAPMQSGDSKPQGGTLPNGDSFTVGVAAPYVKSSADGSALVIVAPGLTVATSKQTAYLAGGELRVSSLGLEVPFVFQPTAFGTGTRFRSGGNVFSIPATEASSGNVDYGEEPGKTLVSVRQIDAGPLPVLGIVGFGGLVLAMLMGGWIRRFAWGRRLFAVQPFRTLDWIYRAFVRT